MKINSSVVPPTKAYEMGLQTVSTERNPQTSNKADSKADSFESQTRVASELAPVLSTPNGITAEKGLSGILACLKVQNADSSLEASYEAIRAEATKLAGSPDDFAQRVSVLHDLYLDSHGNYAFPQVALHGALWASRFFEVTGTLGKIVSLRYFYNPTEMKKRHKMLDDFASGFKKVNREVFIDTYTNYHFSKKHGGNPEANQFLPKELLKGLNSMHQASRENRSFTAEERRELFQTALTFEQEGTVGPEVTRLAAEFDCPIMRNLILKPIVQFEYFPKTEFFLFKDFSNKQERIERALQSYDISVKQGWDHNISAMKEYGVLPQQFFDNPKGYVTTLKQDLGVSEE